MMDEMEFDVASRRLCPDGSCTGIIGADGKCTECGRTQTSSELGATAASVSEAGETPFLVDAQLDASADRSAEADDVAAFDANRPLCPDGACVGVLGSDGRCSVCGKIGRSA